jgi:hypothetical protein
MTNWGSRSAVIAGPASDSYRIPLQDYPQTYWDNQNYNLNTEKGREPFREFSTIFHDEIVARPDLGNAAYGQHSQLLRGPVGLRRPALHVVPRAGTRGRPTEAAQILCRVEVEGELHPVTPPGLELPFASRAQVAGEAARAEEERQGVRGTQQEGVCALARGVRADHRKRTFGLLRRL